MQQNKLLIDFPTQTEMKVYICRPNYKIYNNYVNINRLYEFLGKNKNGSEYERVIFTFNNENYKIGSIKCEEQTLTIEFIRIIDAKTHEFILDSFTKDEEILIKKMIELLNINLIHSKKLKMTKH
jgi:hypothetical protein